MPWALDHHLNVVLPGFFRQFAEYLQFRELRFVARVRDAPGPQSVTQRKAHVVLLENLANLIEPLIQKILLLVMLHPVRHQRAAPAHNPRDALPHKRHMLPHHPRVNRHVIHALLGLLFDDFQHQLERQILRPPYPRNRFVHRHRAHRHRRSLNNRLANFRDVAAGGEVHHRVRSVMHRVVQLFQLFVNVRARHRVPDVRVDFALRRDADGHRLEVAVMDVCGNDAASPRHFAANQLGLKLFALGDVLHFFRDHALPREIHLRHVPVAVCFCSFSFSFFNPAIAQCHNSPQKKASGACIPETVHCLPPAVLKHKLWHPPLGAATLSTPLCQLNWANSTGSSQLGQRRRSFAACRCGTCFRSGSAVRVKELVGDVSENGSAAGGDAALGDEDEEARQELPEVGTDPGPGELRKKVGGEVERITWGLPTGSPCGAQTEMVRTKTKLRFRAGKTAALAI